MSTLYGEEYVEEIDEIYKLALQHLRKYGENDSYNAYDRIFGAISSAMTAYNQETRNK